MAFKPKSTAETKAKDLGLDSGTLYDPMVNYRRVKGKWFDWDYDPAPTPKATRTVDSAPQNANVSPEMAQQLQ